MRERKQYNMDWEAHLYELENNVSPWYALHEYNARVSPHQQIC